jgi:alpha-1,2-mannosyltransferase
MRRAMLLRDAPHREPTTRRLPDLWLVPGVAALLVSLALYVTFVRAYPRTLWDGLDLHVYLGAGEAVRHGLDVYRLGFTGRALPYTYPPITLVFSAALSLLSFHGAHLLMTALSTVAAGLVAWVTLGMLGYRSGSGRLGVTCLATAGSVWLEPFQQNYNLGQVNVLLMLLVLADLARPDSRRWKGVGVGLAAGAKLVPGIFIGYLLITRRFRAALVSAGVFALTMIVGFALFPHAAATYWGGEFLDTKRVASVATIGYIGNQSLHGALARTGIPHADLVFYPVALVVLGAGLALAALAARRGGDLLGILVAAFTALLASPIAWTHHWVWVLPLLVYAWATAARLTGRRRQLAASLAALLSFLFLAWPYRVGGQTAPLVPYGWLWKLHSTHGGPMAISPVKHVIWEYYTLTVLGLGALLAGWLWTTRRTGTVTGSGTGTGDPPTVTVSSRNEPSGVNESEPREGRLPGSAL